MPMTAVPKKFKMMCVSIFYLLTYSCLAFSLVPPLNETDSSEKVLRQYMYSVDGGVRLGMKAKGQAVYILPLQPSW